MPALRLLLVALAALLLTACPSDDDGFGDRNDADADGHQPPADCDDGDDGVHPGAAEVCDGVDNDCDGVVDAGDMADAPEWHRDQDRDGHGDPEGEVVRSCERPDGYGPVDDDCDDGNADRFPGNPEICDGLDNDCDANTEADDGEEDEDGDGSPACEDCNDDDPDSFPGNEEVCDGVDSDCDGSKLPAETVDNDIDGSPACEDCDDQDSETYPGAKERCDGRDTDCNDLADFGGDPASELDGDGDGFMACAECDDDEITVRPGIQELCDGVDTDCSGAADFQGEPEVDLDGDGGWSCDDCDDDDVTVFSGATELCDGLDNDCNGATDFDAAGEIDTDNDGYPSCNDCLDGDPLSFPGAPELCDGADNDCDGSVDVGTIAADLDGFGDRLELPPLSPGAAITVEAWVWLDNLLLNGNPQARTVVHKSDGSGGDDVVLGATDDFDVEGSLALGGASYVDAGANLAEMQWYHLAMTYDGAVQRLYVDGAEVGTTSNAAGLALSATGAWTLGARDESGVFVDELDGMIDEVRVWDVARTATEIDADRCTPLTGTEPGLVAYLPLDTDLLDLTGNGNDATAVGDAILLPF